MARGLAGALSEGIEAGFGMGLAADDREQRRQQREIDNARHAAQDARAEQEFGLRRQREERVDREQRQERAYGLLDKRQKEIVETSRAAQAAGGAVDPSLAEEYGLNSEQMARIRQDALNFFSRVQTGQIDPLDKNVKPGELYLNMTAATGMEPGELKAVPQHIADVQAGLETGNQGLMLQGVNGLLAPQLRMGLGAPSPYGGTITRKEIIGLDPARDGNGVDHPDKVIPRLRVYVKGDDGQERYYDAPLTRNRSTDPDDPVSVLQLGKAFDWMGQLGVLANAVQRPDIAEKLAQGEKESGGKAKRYIEQLTQASRPTKNAVEYKAVPAGGVLVGFDAAGKEVSRVEGPAKKGSATGLQATIDAIDGLAADGSLSPDDAEALKKAAAKRAATGLKQGAAGGSGGGGGAVGSAGVPGNSKLTGEEYLASLPQADRAIVKGLADGSIKPDAISTKGNRREQMLAAAKQYAEGADLTGRKPDTEKPLPAKERQLLTEARSNASTMTSLLQSWKADFASKGVLGLGADASLSAKGVLGLDKESVDWWKNYRKMAELVERHSMFGASLTAGEQSSWRSADISPGMDADVIKRNLETRTALAEKVLEATQQDLVDSGYGEERVRKIGGRDVTVPLGVNRPPAPAPAAPGRAPAATQPLQTAVNPRTGERLVLKDGRWQPVQ